LRTGEVNLFLSPHNDDETLFGAYTLLWHKPHVIVVLRSFVEASWSPPVDYREREWETDRAMEMLTCTWEQWMFSDDMPDWDQVRSRLTTYTPRHVWAPAWEEGGHAHHNALSEIAADLWPDRTTFYLTYTRAGKSEWGRPVETNRVFEDLKHDAMLCYRSQREHPYTAPHFERGLAEYYE
jgi:LmbE family N-acetylglucosaminyl deacetylase